jgi:hypothetical protein
VDNNGSREETTLVLAHWSFVKTGLDPIEQWLSASLAEPGTSTAPSTEGEIAR